MSAQKSISLDDRKATTEIEIPFYQNNQTKPPEIDLHPYFFTPLSAHFLHPYFSPEIHFYTPIFTPLSLKISKFSRLRRFYTPIFTPLTDLEYPKFTPQFLHPSPDLQT